MEFEKIVMEKLVRIENAQMNHTIQLTRNTDILERHERRSTNLESRMLPIEDFVKFCQRLFRMATTILVAIGALTGLVKLFLSK